MKHIFLMIAVVILFPITIRPSFAQSSQESQPVGDQNANTASLIQAYGRVSQVSGNQFVLKSNVGQLTVIKGQTIDFQPNEPIVVTGIPDAQSGALNAYSITRSDGTNITFGANGISVQRLADILQ